jgi:hypothetical protein
MTIPEFAADACVCPSTVHYGENHAHARRAGLIELTNDEKIKKEETDRHRYLRGKSN